MPARIDLSRRRFGKLLVLRPYESAGVSAWECLCDCGNIRPIPTANLLDGSTRSCGCLIGNGTNERSRDLTGLKFDRLTVIKKIKNSGQWKWLCQCDCESGMAITSSYELESGHTRSCGCLNGEKGLDLTGQRFGKLTVVELARKGTARAWVCKCDCGGSVVATVGNLTSGRTWCCGCERKPRKGGSRKYLASGEAAFMSLVAQYKAGAKRRGLEFSVSGDALKSLFQSACRYCGCTPKQVKKGRHDYGDFVYNGVDRIDSSKGYIEGNLVSCCKACNVAKAKMSDYEFVQHCARIASESAVLTGNRKAISEDVNLVQS